MCSISKRKNMTRQACPSTEQIQAWWTQKQTKGATKLYAVQDGGIYRLRAFSDDRKKCGEFSLGIRDKRLAQRIALSMAITVDDQSPTSVINKYIEHLTLHKKACQTGRHALTTLAESVEHNIKTIKSRLSAHLIPFCGRRHISDINDMYRREIIRAYLDEIKETTAISDTARSIMASTLTFLKWYDGKLEKGLMNATFYEEIKGWRGFFGSQRKRSKIFLTREQIQAILRYKYPNERIKAMFLLPLTCGVRYNELVNIRWGDLHISRGNMDITVAKGGTSRKAQLPQFIQKFLENVQRNRVSGILPGDYLFTGYDRNSDLGIYKSILKEITGEDSNDMASNCLRRSGCNLIEKYRHGLGDLQLGHSICTRVTHRSYIDGDDYQEVNDFWDDFYRESISPKAILCLSTFRELKEIPRQTQYIHLDTDAG